MKKIPLSVLIPTRNEERNLPDCLRSVAWADEVVVFDSHSTDRTIQIAREMGARVVSRTFDNFAAHKNWALANVPFRNDWILILDADERIGEPLAREIGELLANGADRNGYYIARRNFFAGKWIRRGGWYPNWNLRLLRKGKGRYESRIVHEHILLEGEAGFLRNPMDHRDDKGIERYFDRHNRYSSMEAVELFRLRARLGARESLPAALAARGPERRRFLKNWAYRVLPARPLFKFLWMYVVRLGFLDGRIGFRYCLLHTFYEYQISLKLKELEDPGSPLRRQYATYLGDDGS